MDSKVEMYYSEEERENVWNVRTDGTHIKAVSNYLLEDGIAREGIDRIVATAAYGLGLCPDPADCTSRKETGLVIGKVQSGKTSSFIALTALAFDNGYNLVVVLGGTKKKLLKQNSDRIKEYFHQCKDVCVLDTKTNADIANSQEILKFIRQGKKIIVVGLKHTSHINEIRQSIFDDGSLANQATLIIDDEGDETSLNTLVSKGKKSTTYQAIEKLKNTLPRHCFLSITATPQANLLISAVDVLSPDFGVLVKPGEGYCGLDAFHSNTDYTITIPKDEPSVLEEGFPESLARALAMFFIACAEHKRRGMPAGKVSMLVHPSGSKIDHASVNKKIETVLDEWRMLAEDKKDLAYQALKTRLSSAYDAYRDSTCPDLSDFSELEDDAINALLNCKNHVVNSEYGSEVSDDFYDYNIYVGGNMLGRGLTFKGLTVTYIVRTSKGSSNVDTQEQRARWFGYREQYLDLCRVFAVEKIIDEFRLIRDHDEDLWATLEEAHVQGTRFKDIARIFTLGEGLRMTRTSVAKTETYSFRFWNRQRRFMRDADITRSNEQIIAAFKDANKDNVEVLNCGSGEPYEIIRDADFFDVREALLNNYRFPSDSAFNNSVIDKLASLLRRKGIKPKVDVVWMRYGDTSKHFVNPDGRIDNYSVGRRPKDKSKPATYEGDDNQFKRPGVMQVQIHRIEDRGTGQVSPVVSLYIPLEIVSDLANLVSRG